MIFKEAKNKPAPQKNFQKNKSFKKTDDGPIKRQDGNEEKPTEWVTSWEMLLTLPSDLTSAMHFNKRYKSESTGMVRTPSINQ